ncbi:hypothetical protein AB6N23_08000 [Cellulomonas sp. 179-A 9B4 NHS]|uniref:hypothetical protein n=1 Tax=Cellulomonas sp. 179-A 9B4 NHS TaxID=3142379 RepID=UPI0039A1349E
MGTSDAGGRSHAAPSDALTPYLALDLHGLLRALQERPLAPGDLAPEVWRSLVELVTQQVQHRGGDLDVEGWGVCSAVVTHVLAAAVAADAYPRHEALVRRLHLTGAALDFAGRTDARAALLDARGAVGLAVRALPADVDAVAADADRWRTLPRAEVLRLRRVRHVLTPALALADRSGDERLDHWRDVLPRLP